MSTAHLEILYGFCQCGCGQKTNICQYTDNRRGWIKGQPVKFLHGHNGKGKNNTRWTGGRIIIADGYVKVKQPGHPRASSTGYIREHLLIAEKALGKPLPPGTEVHHVNDMRSDNRNSNLVICPSRAYHRTLHVRMTALKASGDPNKRKCTFCHSWDTPLNMTEDRGSYYHRDCAARRARQYYQEYGKRNRQIRTGAIPRVKKDYSDASY